MSRVETILATRLKIFVDQLLRIHLTIYMKCYFFFVILQMHFSEFLNISE